ncbi:hypothetical protein FK514_27005, partial [Klebsiella pneumoniae]|nr:hypothetical protein [Klebsiella pneumoniae]
HFLRGLTPCRQKVFHRAPVRADSCSSVGSRRASPGKQVTLAHLIAHPGAELAKKIGVPESGAIGIMTLTPGETAMIAGDLAMKAADVRSKSSIETA